jgi:hypothetical protein
MIILQLHRTEKKNGKIFHNPKSQNINIECPSSLIDLISLSSVVIVCRHQTQLYKSSLTKRKSLAKLNL